MPNSYSHNLQTLGRKSLVDSAIIGQKDTVPGGIDVGLFMNSRSTRPNLVHNLIGREKKLMKNFRETRMDKVDRLILEEIQQ